MARSGTAPPESGRYRKKNRLLYCTLGKVTSASRKALREPPRSSCVLAKGKRFFEIQGEEAAGLGWSGRKGEQKSLFAKKKRRSDIFSLA